MPLLWSTDAVATRERFAYWREVISRVFVDLRPEPSVREDFWGRVSAQRLGTLPLARIQSVAQQVHRTERDIAGSPRRVWFVVAQLAGTSRFEQTRGSVELAPGDIVAVDPLQPFRLDLQGAFDHLTLELPRPTLAPRYVRSDPWAGRVLRAADPLSALALDYLQAAVRSTEALPPAAGSVVADQVSALLAVAFAAAAGLPPAQRTLAEARFARACAYIERNLAEPALRPESIAIAGGVSTRYLHRLFSERGASVMQWVQSKRLARCRDELLDPACAGRTITHIAFAWGFSDLTHFGRAFKQEYGVAPSDLRAGSKAH